MAAFRRCVIALAVLAIFAGLASAQAPTPMSCTVTSTGGNVRAEGKTEIVGDIVISCTGGTALVTFGGSAAATSTAVPTMDLTVTLPSNVTSRQTNINTALAPVYASDALLLIDEPQSFGGALVTGFGNGAAPTPCTPTVTAGPPLVVNGCPVYPNEFGNFEVMSPTSGQAIGSPTTGAQNVYQGVASGKTVTFYGVPVLPPGSTASRIFRITNVRIDGTGAGSGAITAGISSVAHTSGIPTAMPTISTTPTVGTVAASLTTTSTPIAVTNCLANGTSNAYTFAGTVTFAEATGFPNAFRTRIAAASNTAGAGQGVGVLGVPGQNSNNTESGYIVPTLAVGTGLTAGLADFGTRLKAVFNAVPAGVHVFVSVSNVTGANVSTNTTGSAFVGTITTGGTATNSLATFVSSSNEAAAWSATPSTTTISGGPLGGNVVEITPSTTGAVAGTSYSAIWEVTNSNGTSAETLTFDVFVVTSTQQTPAQTTVNLSYAPLQTGSPTSTTPENIPNFVNASTTAVNAFSFIQCRTTLLFPFVTSAAGFDTGLVIANTTADTFNTTAQAGTCTFTLYGTPASTIPTTASIAAGTVSVTDLGSSAPGFSGYAIASCNFQFAHGFAYIGDFGNPATSSAMGYLALVLPYSTTRGSVSFEQLTF